MLGLGHATNLLESTDLMGYGWPDLGDPVLSDCDIDALRFVFDWAFTGRIRTRRPRVRTTARSTEPGLLGLAQSSPSSLAALSFMIFGLTASLMSSVEVGDQRSGVISGKSLPNSTLSCSNVLA